MWVISGGWSTMVLEPPASVVVMRSRARSEVRRVAPFTVRRRTFSASAEAWAFSQSVSTWKKYRSNTDRSLIIAMPRR